MKKILFSAVLLLLAVDASATIATKTLSGTKRFDSYSSTFGQSTVDTIKWTREEGVTGISLGIYCADTIDISATTSVRRVVNGVTVTAITADTLANIEAFAVTDAATPGAALDAITLAPLADQYWFIITMHSSNCGTGTANVVNYRVYKQYAK